MSVTSCEVDRPLSPTSGDFCCTEEELFESFMEIVNDPELQGLGNNQEGVEKGDEQNGNGMKNSALIKEKEGEEFINNENKENTCDSITSESESAKHLAQVDCESSHDNIVEKQASQFNQDKNIEENCVLDQDHVNPQESSVNGVLDDTMDNTSKNGLAYSVELAGSTDEHLAASKNENEVDSTTAEEGLNNANSNGTTEPVNTTALDSEISDKNNTDGNLQSTESIEAAQSSIPLETNKHNLNSKSTNEHEPNSDSKVADESGALGPNSQELVEESKDQTELKTIEDDIQESIRMANKVCEELNAITQRLSQSSDELLDDNTTFEGNPTSLTSNVENNNIDSHSKENTESEVTDGQATVNGSMDGDLQTKSAPESKRPNSLPKLVVSPQPSSKTVSSPEGAIPSPSGTTPSPFVESAASPLGISPTHIMHLNDIPPGRKHSASDSLDSSEGSLGTPPTEAKGPINWEILNTAFEDPETDEDEGLYETSGSYGGFGLVLDEDSLDSVSLGDTHAAFVDDGHLLSVADSRYRSVSQSSTISEVEFQEEYKKKHSITSLERKIDGVLCSGYLLKLGGTGITPKNWRKRWCVVRQDRCLYYYKSARDKVPCGIIVLANYIVSHSSECNKKNCIKLSKGGGRTYFLCSETPKDMLRWMEALRKAADIIEEGTNFVIRKEIIHNVAIPALSIKKPDCHGYLTKQGARSTRSWKRRYCVLKNGCLYYYREMADTTALGVAKLHGYTVNEVALTGRRNVFRCTPPHAGMRTFTFTADNEYDKKRWIPCFQESIRAQTST